MEWVIRNETKWNGTAQEQRVKLNDSDGKAGTEQLTGNSKGGMEQFSLGIVGTDGNNI